MSPSVSTAEQVRAALAEVADPADAVHLQRFFKTGPGEYGEGDVFLGVRVPATRAVAKRFADLPLDEIDALLDSAVHEERLAGLLILNLRYARAGKARPSDPDAQREMADAQREMVERYLAAVRRGRVNNWDLVDSSAEYVLGAWLLDKPRDLLAELAAADSLWERRVALLSTFAFIKAGDASTTFALCERLLDDRRDLIQKAVGWMLREVGKRIDPALLTGFLDRHAARLGRTALSYATEHLDAERRAAYRAMR
ncbi:3-methyladenine DNA glycosylase AlkD [Nocardia farcinica]|uniref:DNA alkylation repair enzyme n=1 Tax=Nocardia farcinica TaxID=37329 RepID=A0A0H5P2S0_NOCFR|nr:DNA alkylation repair protein [Nocardia farcinica]AXK87653.1 DNA alkylation repair protein [Nocardia farcinica]MBA4856756.1 DNA alkylation repair protein [Nocardia farcinica]MBC9818900.1 DNA alkylation repair protein [Nocardia farcinica]CRY82165.1 DNA alkylation repair enzyme [Nocardia farcinica]SIT32191.1 3-methyladenine DNA glycosylase AlkD [Nocardia farcinica]